MFKYTTPKISLRKGPLSNSALRHLNCLQKAIKFGIRCLLQSTMWIRNVRAGRPGLQYGPCVTRLGNSRHDFRKPVCAKRELAEQTITTKHLFEGHELQACSAASLRPSPALRSQVGSDAWNDARIKVASRTERGPQSKTTTVTPYSPHT